MQIKKMPMRSCIVTKEKLPKKELVRVVRTPEGKIIVDQTGKANGRGAYLKLSEKIIEQAKKAKILDRHLETDVPESIYDELKSLLK